MKKILICLTAITVFSCKQDVKDYVTLSGKITNKNSDSLFVYQGRGFSKTIKVEDDGTFKDTLRVKTGVYGIYDGNESTNLFLKNGYDLNLTLDTKAFDETIKFSGEGEKTNNYLVSKALMQEKLIEPSIFDLEEDAFNTKIGEINTEMNVLLEKNKSELDPILIASEQESLKSFTPRITTAYKQQQARANRFVDFIGKPSPSFNFENIKGGKTNLKDLKGKYVYIDVWATWCGPCLREIPSLKVLEKEYHDKNIEFVSISVDDGRGYKGNAKEAKAGWKEMIADKQLGGIQLLSDNGWKSSFIQDFKINSIPRFILLDPNGNVVNADAPRPSSPKLKEVFNGLENI